jgi:hypothetical protein
MENGNTSTVEERRSLFITGFIILIILFLLFCGICYLPGWLCERIETNRIPHFSSLTVPGTAAPDKLLITRENAMDSVSTIANL